MSELPDIPKQTALWMSSSKGMHIPIYRMSDRHLLGAIGVVQKYALWEWQDDPNAESDSKWWDYVPMNQYIPLIKECLRRFLTVPGEELLRQVEIAWMEVEPEPPCCCTCEYRPVFTCVKEDSEKFGHLRPCLFPCDKYKKKEPEDAKTT